jgi:glucose-1-phosphate thymidylyltransferase
LAGGSGSRLYPMSKIISKQLLPVYDKPMIYYPLCTLMLSGIRDILLITTIEDREKFVSLLGDGSSWGINISYEIQIRPNGLAEAFIIGKNFIGNSLSALILGDNIFHGHDLFSLLNSASQRIDGATVFAYHVSDPERYGIINFDKNFKALTLEEKPKHPKSNFAVTGLYFYDNDVVTIAQDVKPSKRGELEITDINNIYLKKNKLNIEVMKRGFTWLDTGTPESLLQASQFINTLESRQGLKVGCPEEVAFRNGWINDEVISKLLSKMPNNDYKSYIFGLIN